MTEKQLEELISKAKDAGYSCAVIDTQQIPFNFEFRKYCEENRCGCYDSNCSCPPACGTPQQMSERVLSKRNALVLMSESPINGYSDTEAISAAKKRHNDRQRELVRILENSGVSAFCAGASHCDICEECEGLSGRPCKFPKDRFSCLSAYCVDVAKLAELAGLRFEWNEHRLYNFGMILF